MIQPKYKKQNNTIFLGFDSIEINLVFPLNTEIFTAYAGSLLVFLAIYPLSGAGCQNNTYMSEHHDPLIYKSFMT